MAGKYTFTLTLVANTKTSVDAGATLEPLQLGVKIQNTSAAVLEIFVADAVTGYQLPASAVAWFPTKLAKQLYVKSSGTPVISFFCY